MAIDGLGSGLADGIKTDTQGNLWVGAGWVGEGYDGVHVFAPDGDRIGQIVLPEICSNLCFGGQNRDRLFMTASQSVYAMYVNARGAHYRLRQSGPRDSAFHFRQAGGEPERGVATGHHRLRVLDAYRDWRRAAPPFLQVFVGRRDELAGHAAFEAAFAPIFLGRQPVILAVRAIAVDDEHQAQDVRIARYVRGPGFLPEAALPRARRCARASGAGRRRSRTPAASMPTTRLPAAPSMPRNLSARERCQ